MGSEYDINVWSGHQAEPYDLLAAAHILEGAKGEMLNEQVMKINPANHKGVFLAGINSDIMRQIIKDLIT
jgi:hypothetical protein